MKGYIITSKAGRRVAGRRNTGVGTRLILTEDEASAAVDAGELVAAATDTVETPENFAQEGPLATSGGKGSGKAKKAPAGEKTGV